MEDRRDHRLHGFLAAFISWLLLSDVWLASAQLPDEDPFRWEPTITVDTNADAVVVDSQIRGSVPGGSGIQVSGSGSNCTLEATNIGSSLSEDFWGRPYNELPFFLWCDGRMVGLVWIAIESGVTGGAALSPEAVAMQLRDRIPIPNVTIGANPSRGLVGVESWFWIEGYDGEPIIESTASFGQKVDVEARVQRYQWDFGDGKSIITESPGQPYPERSQVEHIYEHSSLGQGMGYPVEVAFLFSVRYRVDGGAWTDLPGIERVAQGRYSVRESQAVIRN